MPTGYTAKLMESGQTFNEFALQCARAFGACIMMRDDPMDAAIPEAFEEASYYSESLERAKVELAKAEALNENERLAMGARLKREAITNSKASIEKQRAENERLGEMECQVIAWFPPTPDHQGLKDFMLQQISISKNDLKYCDDQLWALEQKSPKQYWFEYFSERHRHVSYCEEALEGERRRTAERNGWVRALRESLRGTAA